MNDLGHVLETILGSTVPIFLYMWNNRRTAKSDVAKKHEENQRMLNEILTEQKYFPPHGHSEVKGPLAAEGIRFPP